MLKVDEERLRFVRYWAKYVREHDPMEWSKQQNILINSVLRTTIQDVELYLKIKEKAKEILNKLKQKSSAKQH